MGELRDSLAECIPHKNPCKSPDYTEAEVQAIRACYNGQADERQQRLALEYIIRCAGTHDMSFRPMDPHLTSFAEGKRFVGTTLIWMLKTAPARTDPDRIAVRNIENE